MHESCQAVAWRFHCFQTYFRVLSVTRHKLGTWSPGDARRLAEDELPRRHNLVEAATAFPKERR